MVASLPTTGIFVDASSLPIENVTVYQPSGAQVIRKLNVDLKAGTNVIQVANLSSTAETESLRVDGLGNARLLVIQCALDQRPEIPKSDPIQDLTSQLKELQAEKRAREKEVALLKAFGKSIAEKRDTTPDQAIAFFEVLFGKILACGEVVGELCEKIARLNQKINKLRSSRIGEASTKATVTIFADEDGPAGLRLVYRVLDAYWHPLYDLYTISEGGAPCTAVSLCYRVNVQQYTGEDWTNAKLILSTSATDVLNAGVPKSDDLVVRPPTPAPTTPTVTLPPPVEVLQCFFRASLSVPPIPADREDDVVENMGFEFNDDNLPPPPPELVQSAAVISKDPMTVSYTVETLTTIPSNAILHKVLVATIPLEAVITHITTPRKFPIAYLQCAIKNTSEYYLLPGVVNVFVNDSYVSQTNISDIATGDTFNCTLGMDTSIRVSHELTQSSVTSLPTSFIEQHTTTTYTSTTKLHNRHTGDYPVNIIERSSIPTASENEPRIKVFLKGPNGLAQSEDGQEVDLGREDGFKVKWGKDTEDTRNGQKEGKFIWYGALLPGEEVVLVSEWEVRAPVDTEWRVKSE